MNISGITPKTIRGTAYLVKASVVGVIEDEMRTGCGGQGGRDEESFRGNHCGVGS